MNTHIKRIFKGLAVTSVAVITSLVISQSCFAQFGNSSSWSSSRSSSWSSESGFGPNGYFNNKSSQQSGKDTSSNTQWNGFGPQTTGTTTGFNNSQNRSSGYNARTGAHYNRGGNTQKDFGRTWRW